MFTYLLSHLLNEKKKRHVNMPWQNMINFKVCEHFSKVIKCKNIKFLTVKSAQRRSTFSGFFGPPFLFSFTMNFSLQEKPVHSFRESVSHEVPKSICWTETVCVSNCVCQLMHTYSMYCGTIGGCSISIGIGMCTWFVWLHESHIERRRRLHLHWCCCRWSSSD